MLPFGLRPEHLFIIAIVALLIFGPSRLPEIGRAFGKTIREFQSATKEATQGLQEELSSKPVTTTSSVATAAPVAAAEVKKEEPATVACKNCGKPVLVGSKFCSECGTAQ